MSHNPADFVSRIEIIYNDEKPRDTIDEINGGPADINKGQGGSHVWLKVHRAEFAYQLINNISIDIGEDSDERSDLARGAGGDYRYIGLSSDTKAAQYVTDVALWRSEDSQDSPPAGWHGKSVDINSGRGGDYLYLVWRTKEFKEWKSIP